MGGLSATIRDLAANGEPPHHALPQAVSPGERGWREHITFDPPPAEGRMARDMRFAFGDLPEEQRFKTEAALDQIWATPEGRAQIERTAADSDSGMIHILHSRNGISAALDQEKVGGHSFVLGTRDQNFRYPLEDGSGRADMSIQRLIVHELQHLDPEKNHGAICGDEAQYGGISLIEEAQAVNATNDFMEKYFGDPRRDPDTTGGADLAGTDGHDWNPNFLTGPPAEGGPDGHTSEIDAGEIAVWRAQRASAEFGIPAECPTSPPTAQEARVFAPGASR